MSGVTSRPPLMASLCARRQRLLTTAMRMAVSIEGLMPPATSVPSPTLRPSFIALFTLGVRSGVQGSGTGSSKGLVQL